MTWDRSKARAGENRADVKVALHEQLLSPFNSGTRQWRPSASPAPRKREGFPIPPPPPDSILDALVMRIRQEDKAGLPNTHKKHVRAPAGTQPRERAGPATFLCTAMYNPDRTEGQSASEQQAKQHS